MKKLLLFLTVFVLPFFVSAQAVNIGYAKQFGGDTSQIYFLIGNYDFGDMPDGYFRYSPSSTAPEDSINILLDGTFSPVGRLLRTWKTRVKLPTVTSSTTITLDAENTFIPVDATSSNKTITINPTHWGQTAVVQKIDNTANTVTISVTGSLINAASNYIVTSPGETIPVECYPVNSYLK